MASNVTAYHDPVRTEMTKNDRSSGLSTSKPKERICNRVLRDEDEETDDEDLSLRPNSSVSILILIFTQIQL